MVMVTHGAIVANIHMGPAVLPLTPDDITVAFLPSAHIAQRVVVEMLPILSGTAVSFAESLLKLPARDQSRAAHLVSRAAARVGAHLYQHPHGDSQEAGHRAEGLLRRAWASGLGGRQIQARREDGSAADQRAAAIWRTGSSSARFATDSAGACASPHPAPRRWAPIWPSSTKRSACR